jgi:hypothetical protein
LKPLKTEKAALEKSINERVEKIEKSSPGSQQGIPAGGGSNSGSGVSGPWV